MSHICPITLLEIGKNQGITIDNQVYHAFALFKWLSSNDTIPHSRRKVKFNEHWDIKFNVKRKFENAFELMKPFFEQTVWSFVIDDGVDNLRACDIRQLSGDDFIQATVKLSGEIPRGDPDGEFVLRFEMAYEYYVFTISKYLYGEEIETVDFKVKVSNTEITNVDDLVSFIKTLTPWGVGLKDDYGKIPESL